MIGLLSLLAVVFVTCKLFEASPHLRRLNHWVLYRAGDWGER